MTSLLLLNNYDSISIFIMLLVLKYIFFLYL